MDRKTRSQALKLLKNAINTIQIQIIGTSRERIFSEIPINEISGYKTYYGNAYFNIFLPFLKQITYYYANKFLLKIVLLNLNR